MAAYTLYGRDISLFTRKLEAALQFYGADFDFVTKDDTNRESLERRAATHQIPVLETPEAWMLADTTPILAVLDSRFPSRRLVPEGPLGVLVHIVEEVLDEWMARTMVHYRWHYDENIVAVTSKLAGRRLSFDEARAVPLAQWGLRACRATGTEGVRQQAAAEHEYEDLLDVLAKQLETTAFSMGDRPSAVDTIIIGSLRGHTNHDPSPDVSRYANVLAWDDAVATYKGPAGDWASFPDSTPFAAHVLKLARECYAPFALANAQALKNAKKAFVIDMYGEPVSYLCRAYPERSRQMIVDRIAHQLNADERRQVKAWLSRQGLDHCFPA